MNKKTKKEYVAGIERSEVCRETCIINSSDLICLYTVVMRILRKTLGKVSWNMFSVISVVNSQPSLTKQEIHDFTGLSIATVDMCLRQLLKNSYIDRSKENDDDKRFIYFAITDEGREYYKKTCATIDTMLEPYNTYLSRRSKYPLINAVTGLNYFSNKMDTIDTEMEKSTRSSKKVKTELLFGIGRDKEE